MTGNTLTRPRHMSLISGCAFKRGAAGWMKSNDLNKKSGRALFPLLVSATKSSPYFLSPPCVVSHYKYYFIMNTILFFVFRVV